MQTRKTRTKLLDLPRDMLEEIISTLNHTNRAKLSMASKSLKMYSMKTQDGKNITPGQKYYVSFSGGWLYGQLTKCKKNTCLIKISHFIDPKGHVYIDNPPHVMEFKSNLIYANRKRPYALRSKKI
jgi:hypothetical protein